MKTCSETFQFEKDLKWENPAPGVNRQIMAYDGQLMMVKVKFDKGAVGTMHEHYHSQATYVVSGKFELTIGDKKPSPLSLPRRRMSDCWKSPSLRHNLHAFRWK